MGLPSRNKVELIGTLGKDPEKVHTNSGDECTVLSVATSDEWRDKNTGEKKERVEWHRVVLWGPTADNAYKYLKKGSRVFLEGKLQTRKWTDQSGQTKYTTEVVLPKFQGEVLFLDRKPSAERREEAAGRSQDDFPM